MMRFLCFLFFCSAFSQGHGDSEGLCPYRLDTWENVLKKNQESCLKKVQNSSSTLENSLSQKCKSLDADLKQLRATDKANFKRLQVDLKAKDAVVLTLSQSVKDLTQKLEILEQKVTSGNKETLDQLAAMVHHLGAPLSLLRTEKFAKLPLTKIKTGVYLFDTTVTNGQGTKWRDAKDFCVKRGMKLASFETEEEMRLVLAEAPIKDSWGYWMDASDLGRAPGQFHWADGRVVDKSWFGRGQPDDFGSGKETCVTLWPKIGKLTDLPCSYTAFISCEVSA